MSSPFTIPAAPVPLDPRLQQIVEQSATRFEGYLNQRLGHWAAVPQIKENITQWVRDFRSEVAEVARQAHELK